MNSYELRRQKLRAEQEKDIGELEKLRSTMTDKQYWDSIADIYDNYSKQLAELDSEERTRESLAAAANGQVYKRPEATYQDALGQLKAQKESELLMKLSQLDTNSINMVTEADISIKDPFYLDKKDPMSVFERWWVEYVSTLPSITEVRAFLNSIDLNEYGVIYVKTPEVVESKAKTGYVNEAANILKSSVLESSRKKRAALKKEQERKKRLKSPLIARLHTPKYSNTDVLDSFKAIISSYDLPASTMDLLEEHAEECCIPKGIVHVDHYKNMIEQFLRNVAEPDRDRQIKIAINRGWRELYYVN